MSGWYLRSYRDEDTHRAGGVAADGTVRAVCGAIFRPVAHPLDGTPACLTSPADPLQVLPGLPTCQGGPVMSLDER